MEHATKEALWGLGGAAVGIGVIVTLVVALRPSSASAQTQPIVNGSFQPGHRYRMIGGSAALVQAVQGMPDGGAASAQGTLDATYNTGLFTVQSAQVANGQIVAVIIYNGQSPLQMPPPGSFPFVFVDLGQATQRPTMTRTVTRTVHA